MELSRHQWRLLESIREGTDRETALHRSGDATVEGLVARGIVVKSLQRRELVTLAGYCQEVDGDGFTAGEDAPYYAITDAGRAALRDRPGALAERTAEYLRQENARLRTVVDDLVRHALLAHPLPWRVERDWTHEVTAKDGAILAKCMTPARAEAVVAEAVRVRAELDEAADACGLCGEPRGDAEGVLCAACSRSGGTPAEAVPRG